MSKNNDEGFTHLRDNLIKETNLSLIEAVVYSKIKTFIVNNEQKTATISNGWLADVFGVSERTITNTINKLEDKKFIRTEVKRSNKNGVIKTNRKFYLGNGETNIQPNIEHKQEVDVYKSNKQTEELNVMQMFNMKFETNYKSIPGNLTNLCIEYKIEDFAKVINNAFEDQFWKDKATPSSIFKTENFERLLNQKPKQKEITIADLDIDYSDF